MNNTFLPESVQIVNSELPTETECSICVVIPAFNRIALARPVFEALRSEAQRDASIVVVVVDQGSTDGTDVLATDCGFVLVRSSEPTAGGLRNVGVARSRSRWLSFIDSDVLISEGYFQRLRAILEQNESSIVGCNYCLPASPNWTEKHWHSLTYQRGSGPRRWLNAGNMAMSRALFESLGGFDEALSSGEDTELCRRALEQGYSVQQFEDVSAAHLGNPKSLSAFFRKQVWHGQGAPLTDRNSIAAVSHVLLLTSIAFFLLRIGSAPFSSVVYLAALANTVPAIALILSSRKTRATTSIPLSLVLLHVYFIARFTALLFRSGKQR